MESKESFIEILNKLNGFKIVFKELHWLTKNNSAHLLFDTVYDAIHEFQDNFAEEGFTIYGLPEKNSIFTIQIYDEESQNLEGLKSFLMEIKSEISLVNIDGSFDGMIKLCNGFLHSINKFIYLSKQD